VVFLDKGDLPIVKLLREQGVLPAESDADGPDAASGVTASDKADKVARLFSKLPDIGYDYQSARTSGSNMPELAKALLAHGADPNISLTESPPQLRMRRKPIISLQGTTPFMLAAASHDVDSMRILAEGGAKLAVKTVSDPKEVNNKDHGQENQIQGNGTPLLVAAGLGRKDDMGKEEQRRSLEAVRTLVEMGADVNEASDTGWTPLHSAAFVGADGAVEYLVSKGANLNARNGCGQTPLSLAAGASARGLLQRAIPHPSTAELLRNLGAVKNPPNNPVGNCVLGRFGLDYASVKEEGN
jgi:ankyrin repeat protein